MPASLNPQELFRVNACIVMDDALQSVILKSVFLRKAFFYSVFTSLQRSPGEGSFPRTSLATEPSSPK